MSFEALWASTVRFHRRFRGEYRQSLESAKRVHGEEGVEVLLATERARLIKELCDQFVTGIGIAIAMEISMEELQRGMKEVAAENDAKMPPHYYRDPKTDKIRRRLSDTIG